ncbi:hypothetical protein [Streptomyces sp. NPDC126522]|uniref:hypothetical protein n=1 Tax=Streptomyces sp. NPDC126522 TaxID=3155211 RepID=UPI003323BA38
MSHRSWETAVHCLEAKIAPATAAQLRVAEAIGLPLAGSEPQMVAAAMLEDYLKPLIRGVPPQEATDRQVDFLAELGYAGIVEGVSANLASSWIDYHLTLLNITALSQMKFQRGDSVAMIRDCVDVSTGEILPDTRVWVISSIDRRGRVHFKGGGGRGAWPSQLYRMDD